MQQQKAAPSRVVLDPTGTIGRAYGARTTPQMVIIDPKGTVVYNGAIDSVRSANPADIAKATNFVTQAFTETVGVPADSVWITIQEVPRTQWGVAGQTLAAKK
jgi:phenylpyruvate tautomerase PptA (4-oxalocrotonate tautomerase family)